MIRMRFRLLKSLGWLGYLGGLAAVVLVLLTAYLGITSIITNDDRMASWVGIPAGGALLISMLLTIAMERKRRQ